MTEADDPDEALYADLAAAYVRGRLGRIPALSETDAALRAGREAGLKLHRFKRTMGLPRVRAIIGALRGIGPVDLVDIGAGRGVFLWPLLDAFPTLPVTAIEPDPRRADHLRAVCAGGVDRLTVIEAAGEAAALADGAADVVTALEVLEHQRDPAPLARAALRLARRFVLVTVPSKPDENPEHVTLFTGDSLAALLRDLGAASVRLDYAPNHIIAVARLDRSP